MELDSETTIFIEYFVEEMPENYLNTLKDVDVKQECGLANFRQDCLCTDFYACDFVVAEKPVLNITII